jgi:hypothetical protein
MNPRGTGTTRSRPPPRPPRPDAVRRIPGRGVAGGFGWLEDRLLRERWLARVGPEATAVLVLLALAADRNGVSYYRRETMVGLLGMTRDSVDRALARLQDLGLVAHRAWGPDQVDGVWQLLAVPHAAERVTNTDSEATSISEILARRRPGITRSPPPAFCGS